MLGQGQSYFVDVKGGRLRLEHHTEKLPEVFLVKDKSEEYGQDSARVKERRENGQCTTDLHIPLFYKQNKERMLQRPLTNLALVSQCRVDRAVMSRSTVETSLVMGSNPQKCHLRPT